jgi:hypothetical protein
MRRRIFLNARRRTPNADGVAMQEIVTIGAVTRLFVALAVLSPVIGIGWAVMAIARGRDRRQVRYTALLISLSGPVNGCLWQLYNLLTDLNGLDTVRNFAINVTVFMLIGLIVGVVLGRLQPNTDAATIVSMPLNEDERNDVAATE